MCLLNAVLLWELEDSRAMHSLGSVWLLESAFVFTAATVPVDDDRGLFHNVVESVIVVGWSVRRECRAVHRNVTHGNG